MSETKQKKSHGILFTIFIIMGILIIAGVIGENLPPDQASINIVQQGQQGYLLNTDKGKSSSPIEATVDETSFDQLYQANLNHDTMGIQSMEASLKIALLQQKIKVLVIGMDAVDGINVDQIRVLEGSYTGASLWVDQNFVIKKLK